MPKHVTSYYVAESIDADEPAFAKANDETGEL
jgi:hypothetical protein